MRILLECIRVWYCIHIKVSNHFYKKSNFWLHWLPWHSFHCVQEPRVHYRNETTLTTTCPSSPTLSWASALRKHAGILDDIWHTEGTMTEWNNIDMYWSSGTWARTAQWPENTSRSRIKKHSERSFWSPGHKDSHMLILITFWRVENL